MFTSRRGTRRRQGRHAPEPEYRLPRDALMSTPTGEVLDLETGRWCSFVPPKYQKPLNWAEEVEREEREEKERIEREDREDREREEKEREEYEKEMREFEEEERREKERKKRERSSRRRAEEEEQLKEYREWEKTGAVPRRRVEDLVHGRRRPPSDATEFDSSSANPAPVASAPRTAAASSTRVDAGPATRSPSLPRWLRARATVATVRVASLSLSAAEEPRREAPVGESAEETVPQSQTKVGEGVSEEEQQSREAQRELDEYLEQDQRGTPLGGLVEEILALGPSIVLRSRESPEGHVVEPVFQEPETPPEYWLHYLPVPSSSPTAEPMEWDEDFPAPTLVTEHPPGLHLPPIPPEGSERRERLPTQRRRRTKSRPYNPRRHLEFDDYVSARPTPPVSPPLPGPERRTAASPTRGRDRVGNGETGRGAARSRSRVNEDAVRGESLGEPRIKTRGIMFGDLVPIPTDFRVDPPPRACYNCWQKGHSFMECPRAVVRTYCHNCGRSGATVWTCPRCRDPHVAYMAQQPQEGTSSISRNLDLPVEERERREADGVTRGRAASASTAEGRPPVDPAAPSTSSSAAPVAGGTGAREVSLQETLLLLHSLQDLPIETRDTVLRRVFGSDPPR